MWDIRTKISLTPTHDDIIKWKHFPRYWLFVQGIHRLPANYTQKGQWGRALMFTLICVWTLSKQSWRRWFKTPSRSLWRHCNGGEALPVIDYIGILNRARQSRYSAVNKISQQLHTRRSGYWRTEFREFWVWEGSSLLCLILLWCLSVFTPKILTIYMLNFSEGTLTYVYILCHYSTLIWHGYLKSFLI